APACPAHLTDRGKGTGYWCLRQPLRRNSCGVTSFAPAPFRCFDSGDLFYMIRGRHNDRLLSLSARGALVSHRARFSDSVILRTMQTASGNKRGHVVALIAVGFSAVADVRCSR